MEVMSIKLISWPKAKIIETFAPTTNMASIRLLLQKAVQYDLLIHYIDGKSAYLNACLDYEIYVEPPEGFEGMNGNYVWKIKKIHIWVKTEQSTNLE